MESPGQRASSGMLSKRLVEGDCRSGCGICHEGKETEIERALEVNGKNGPGQPHCTSLSQLRRSDLATEAKAYSQPRPDCSLQWGGEHTEFSRSTSLFAHEQITEQTLQGLQRTGSAIEGRVNWRTAEKVRNNLCYSDAQSRQRSRMVSDPEIHPDCLTVQSLPACETGEKRPLVELTLKNKRNCEGSQISCLCNQVGIWVGKCVSFFPSLVLSSLFLCLLFLYLLSLPFFFHLEYI